MDGKENEIAHGEGEANAQDRKGKAGARTTSEAAAAPVTASGAAAAETEAVGLAVELASRDAQIAEHIATIAERDGRIAELEGRLADAEKLGELNESLKTENEQLKNLVASERIDFALQLAGCRNVKAARAVLDDYDGDVAKLKEAEPWLFAAHAAEAAGATGLPNAGAANDGGKSERHWRKLVGLSPKKND